MNLMLRARSTQDRFSKPLCAGSIPARASKIFPVNHINYVAYVWLRSSFSFVLDGLKLV